MSQAPRSPRTIAIASGKGGVGKTSLSLNLAYQLSSLGQKVCLVDVDLGLANLDVVLGLEADYTLEHILFEDVPLKEVIISIRPGLDLIPGGSGVARLASLGKREQRKLVEQWAQLADYDYLLLDNSPGITPQVLAVCLSCKELLLVVTPETTSLTDCYALLKVLKNNGLALPPFLVLNKFGNRQQVQSIGKHFQKICLERLQLRLLPGGAIPEEKQFSAEFTYNAPLCSFAPTSAASKSISQIAQRLIKRPRQNLFQDSPELFWEKCFRQINSRQGLYLPAKSCEGKRDKIAESLEVLLSLQEKEIELVHKDEQLSRQVDRLKSKLFLKDRALTRGDEQAKTIGLVVPDKPMADLLKDILENQTDLAFTPADILREETEPSNVDAFIYCLERHSEKVKKLQSRVNGNPALLISKKDKSVFAYIKNVRASLPQPFNIREFVAKVQEIAG
jgi:MinD-like ATPase involved in chromosome partitioning or flagellar assembly